jgi:molecular chaperone DnaK
MNVSAKDKATDKEQSIRIEASSGLSEEEIEKMKREAEENADSDQKTKETVDKMNSADSLIFQTEKQLKEFGDKLPADKKEPIEAALKELKEAHAAKDLEKIDPAMEKLNQIFQEASQEMYKQQGGAEGGPEGQAEGDQAGGADDEEVTDVDFEEVDEEESKK